MSFLQSHTFPPRDTLAISQHAPEDSRSAMRVEVVEVLQKLIGSANFPVIQFWKMTKHILEIATHITCDLNILMLDQASDFGQS